jgi:CHASE2 domain-containing sensor protein
MKNFKKYSGILLLIIFLIIKLQDSNFVKKIENISYDFFQSIFTVDADFNDVVIVDIDEKSIGENGQFPWRRDIFAKLINKLNILEASVISFDIFFSEEDKQNPKKILEEFNIENNNILDSDESLYKEILSSKVILPVLGDISTFTKNNNSKPKANIVTKGTNGFNYLYNFKNKITSLEKFNDAAQGIGNIS